MGTSKIIFTAVVAAVLVLLLVLIVLSLVLSGRSQAAVGENASRSSLKLDPNDRLLILAPHPDDEVLGCGGVIQQATARGLPLRIVFLTYGDFYEWSFLKYKRHPVLTPRGVKGMGEIRHGEALAADTRLGAAATDLVFLGYPDFGTMRMWDTAWGQAPPVRGILSRATVVPYPDAFRPGAPYRGQEVLQDLTAILREFRPTKVFVSHPADHHPDHKAFYLFTRVALFDVAPEIAPQVYPYLVHYSNWPTPFGRHPGMRLVPPAFLAERIAWQTLNLDTEQGEVKEAALKKHETQYRTTPAFLDSFVRQNELFGDFPAIRLDRRPAASAPAPDKAAEQTALIGEDEAHLVGIVAWAARIDGQDLWLSVHLARPLAREVGCSVRLFGYRRDTPFAALPKLRLAIGELEHKTYDGHQPVGFEGIQVHRSGREIRIRVPLAALRGPEQILATVQMREGPVPLEWTSWRLLEVRDTPTPGD